MADKQTYQDDVISFEIPCGYKVNERPMPLMWSIKKSRMNLVTIDIIDYFNLESEKEQIIIDNQLNEFGYNIEPIEYCLAIGTVFYGGNIRIGDKFYSKYIVGIISLHEKYGIKFTISEDADFDISKYADFFNSIKINEERYFFHYNEMYFPKAKDLNSSDKKQVKSKQKKVKLSPKAKDILDQLDANADNPYYFLPDLEHGYFYTAGNRITLFGDASRWAIAFEKTGYHNRSLEVQIELNYFGNCLMNLDKGGQGDIYDCNAKYFTLIDEETIKEIC